MKLLIGIIIYLFFTTSSFSIDSKLSLDMQDADLADAIRLLANTLHINVIVSPSVSGIVTLHLAQAASITTFNMLLKTHGLAKWQQGNIWYIAPRDELIKRKREEMNWHKTINAAAPLAIKFWQIKYAQVKDVAKLIRGRESFLLSKRGQLNIDERTNILCVRDIIGKINLIDILLKKIDIPVRQISIEARLASVDSDFERELGINFLVKSEKAFESSSDLVGRYSLLVAKLADGSLLDVKLAALEDAGHAELISNPRLFTSDQQPASIEAGEEVPYQEVSEGGGTAIVFKKAVLGLRVIPQILPGDKVLLRLQISQDRSNNKTVLGMPTISTRQIVTNVLVRNGQTIVLGGIYESNAEMGYQGIPFISQIPIVGLLFKQQTNRASKRELLIFVTPKIIANL